jgi:hypothetical protein
MVGLRFGRFIHKIIWSPWQKVTPCQGFAGHMIDIKVDWRLLQEQIAEWQLGSLAFPGGSTHLGGSTTMEIFFTEDQQIEN